MTGEKKNIAHIKALSSSCGQQGRKSYHLSSEMAGCGAEREANSTQILTDRANSQAPLFICVDSYICRREAELELDMGRFNKCVEGRVWSFLKQCALFCALMSQLKG